MATLVSSIRKEAVERAEAHSPFLRGAIAAFPDISTRFIEEGSQAAVERSLAVPGAGTAELLRRGGHALGLAI